MSSCELVTLISSIACCLSKNYTNDELLMFASFFTQLGDTLVTIVTHEENCSKKK